MAVQLNRVGWKNNGQPAINDVGLKQMEENTQKAITELEESNQQALTELMKSLKKEILQLSFPIGQPYITPTNTNPSTILGFGTWERVKGRVLVGLDENDTDFNTIGKEGGEKTHKLTIDEMPAHTHMGTPAIYRANQVSQEDEINAQTGRQGASASTGGGKEHNNLQPYKVVGYMWIRKS